LPQWRGLKGRCDMANEYIKSVHYKVANDTQGGFSTPMAMFGGIAYDISEWFAHQGERFNQASLVELFEQYSGQLLTTEVLVVFANDRAIVTMADNSWAGSSVYMVYKVNDEPKWFGAYIAGSDDYSDQVARQVSWRTL